MASIACNRTYCIIAQFCLIITIAFLVVSLAFSELNYLFGTSISLFIVCYIFYLTANFTSEHSYFLYNQKSENSLESYLKSQFSNPPRITWKIECYHYVRSGKNSRRKVVTKRDSKSFVYYTWKDISGVFHLDSEKAKNSSFKKYVKLDLKVNFELVDDITRLDYQTTKDAYYQQNKNIDSHYSFSETRDMLDYNEYNLVQIGPFGGFGVNKCMFIIFTCFIPIAELYKIYMDSFCIEQQYTIKKILSSRYDVNSNTNAKYESLKPSLVIFKQPSKVFDITPAPLHQNPQLPSIDELNYAKKFSESAFTSYTGNNNDQEYKPHFGDHNSAPVFNNVNPENQIQNQNLNVEQNQQYVSLNQNNLV